MHQSLIGDGTSHRPGDVAIRDRPVGEIGCHDQAIGDAGCTCMCCWPSRPRTASTFQYNFNGDGPESGGCARSLTPGSSWSVRATSVHRLHVGGRAPSWTVVGSDHAGDERRRDRRSGLFVTSHNGAVLNTVDVRQRLRHDKRDAATYGVAGTVDGYGRRGAGSSSGSADYSGGTFTVTGGGNDIWADADQFQFVHQSLTGDGEIIARVTAQEPHRRVGQSRGDDQTVHDRRITLCAAGRHADQRDSTSNPGSTRTSQARPPRPQHLAQADPHRRHHHQLHLHRRTDLDSGRLDHPRPDRQRVDRPVRHLPQRRGAEHRDVRQRLTSQSALPPPALPAPWTGSDVGAPGH